MTERHGKGTLLVILIGVPSLAVVCNQQIEHQTTNITSQHQDQTAFSSHSHASFMPNPATEAVTSIEQEHIQVHPLKQVEMKHRILALTTRLFFGGGEGGDTQR